MKDTKLQFLSGIEGFMAFKEFLGPLQNVLGGLQKTLIENLSLQRVLKGNQNPPNFF